MLELMCKVIGHKKVFEIIIILQGLNSNTYSNSILSMTRVVGLEHDYFELPIIMHRYIFHPSAIYSHIFASLFFANYKSML